MNCLVKSTAMVFLSASMAACGQDGRSQLPVYEKKENWSSICLGRFSIDLPNQAAVAEGAIAHHSGYGFEGISGSATTSQMVNRIEVQETSIATPQDLKDIRIAAEFKNGEAIQGAKRIAPHGNKGSGEAKLGSEHAYGFNLGGSFDIGYFDETDARIRLFEGGTGKGDSATVEDVKAKFKELRHLYSPRLPTQLPSEPGICTPYGFFKEPSAGPVTDYTIDVAVRSLKYPSLIIFVTIKPASAKSPKSVDELRDPNNITLGDIKSIKGMGAIAAIAALGNVKKTHGPEKLTIAGQPARLIAREYHHQGTLDTSGSGSGAAYEIQADTVGVHGQIDAPTITLKLAAALPDPFPYPPPLREKNFGQIKITPYEPARPALKGVKTPSFDEGMAYFKQVLASVQTLPQLNGRVVSPSSASQR